ncbi:T9SS sorting signal type C domain-containing protein [Flavobacterium sp.]|uniref:T9SS sorting signal type C domain-containing protein n=1 Tax=Flavobacterium sp. TaxID=239 RepID=UPI0031DB1CF1
MIRKLLLTSVFFFLFTICSFGQTVFSDIISGSNKTWTVPLGVTTITVEIWGGGGAGGASVTNNRGGGGGGGGGYSSKTISVIPGQTITYTVGSGGSPTSGNGNGGTFSSAVHTPSSSSLLANGGNGGNVNGSGAGNGGTGGSATGGTTNTTGANGTNGTTGTNARGGTGGNGANSTGTGGAAGNGSNGGNGSNPGGGGGGAERNGSDRVGGSGSSGQFKVTYTTGAYKSHIISANTGSSIWCPGETRNINVTVRNIGTATWTDGPVGSGTPEIRIGVKWDTNGNSWSDYNVRTPAGNLAPGDTRTYTFTITASNNGDPANTGPLSPGANNLTFDVVNELVSWFAWNNNGVGPDNKVLTVPQTISSIPSDRTVTAQTTAICYGTGTNIIVAASQNGVSYQLRNASNIAIGTPVNGTGSNINLPTGNLTATTTFNVLATNANSCSVQMTNTPTVTINPLHTITSGSNRYTCPNTAITNITMTLGGGATGATVTGLPTGVTSSVTGNTLTISGTPTVVGQYTYSVVTTGNSCTTTSTNGAITVGIVNNIINYNNGTSGTVCIQPAEYNTDSFTAPNGTYFNTVSFASYGTPNGTGCNSFTINYNCHSTSSQSMTEAALLGNTGTISIAASNSVFGDPCVGTTKRLYATASYSQPICAGNLPGTIIGTTPTGSGTYTYLWESSTTSNTTGFSAAIGINNTRDYTPNVLTQDTWFRRTVYAGGCSHVSAVVLVKVTAKRWNGSINTDWNTAANWTPSGVPTATDCVVIPNTINKPIINGTNSYANTLSVTNLGQLTVGSSNTLTITNTIAVNPTAILTFNNNSSLVQTTNAVNTGNITYLRNTQQVRRYDFTYWSSPVTATPAFTLANLSPATLGDKYYSFNPSSGWVINYNGTLPMEKGIGYIVRAPQTFDIVNSSIYTASFVGVPNNGDVTIPAASNSWNLIGNPYPSAIDANLLMSSNSNIGSLYFWMHNSPPNGSVVGDAKYNYTANDYAVFNATGGVTTSNPAQTPTGFIAAGQAFFSNTGVGTNITFTNNMRVSGNNSQFYKPATTNSIEKNRIWLNISNKEGAFKQTLLGYVGGATNNWDLQYDAITLDGNTYIDFYSINDNTSLTIQARALPFENTDVVPMGYKTTVAGEFTIAIDHTDGLFNDQAIYLEDKKTNAIHDLKASDYKFNTAAGTFADRFTLRYTNKNLGTGDFENAEYGLLISVKDKVIKATSSKENITEITVYDVTGKLLYNRKKIGAAEFSISNLLAADQVLVVKAALENNAQITRKIIFK